MRFRASDVHGYFRPSPCALRVWLRHHEIARAESGPFELLLQRLGLEHERRHLASLSRVVDLSDLDPAERERRTLAQIRAGAPALYQPRFHASVELDGERIDLVGEPDFLVRQAAGGYAVRDSKLARRPNASHHRGIPLQLQLYGWLYERVTGSPPAALEVHAGSGDVVPIPYDGGAAALSFLRYLRASRLAESEPWEPVGWSKCSGCGYFERCWSKAEAAHEPSLLPGVDQKLARELRARGIHTIAEVAGAGEPPAGPAAAVRRAARVKLSGTPERIGPAALPRQEDCAFLDLEGLPPHFQELDQVYLWGVAAMGAEGPLYTPAAGGFAPNGDREGWEKFLGVAEALIGERPDLRFVHWGAYEKTMIERYAARYGDASGTAVRIVGRLLDLHRVVRSSVALPVASYGLKHVEKVAGFVRRMSEYEGSLAMARYIEAVETSDAALREAILAEILAYNAEDLDATRAVLEWLRAQNGPPPATY